MIYFRKLGLRLSIPIKVMLFTGIVYLIVFGISVLFERSQTIDFSASVMSVEIRYIVLAVEIFFVALAATIGTHKCLDRPLRKLAGAMTHAEEGNFLVRAPVLSRDELGILAKSFNRMLSRLTDLAANKIETEHDLTVAQEELKYRGELAEKTRIIERTNRTLEHLVKNLSLLYDIGQEVNTIVDLDLLYENITVALKKYLKLNEFAILVFDEKKEVLHVKAACGFADNDAVMRTVLKKGEGITGMATETGKKIYVKDTTKEKRYLHYKRTPEESPMSFLSVPLVFKGEILGAINFSRMGAASFSFSDIKFLTLVAGHVSLAIINARLYTKTRELSVKDDLTDVYNKRHFYNVLQIEWKRAVRFMRDLSLVMIDVDHFKAYNDTFGHVQGDAVLREIGRLLKRNLREVDTVARFGGEEFVLLLPDTDKHGAIAVAEKVRRLLEINRFTDDARKPTRQITLSAGIATFPEDAAEVDELIDRADIALYRAKEAGRNRVVCYSSPTKPKKPAPITIKSVIKSEKPFQEEETVIAPPPKQIQ